MDQNQKLRVCFIVFATWQHRRRSCCLRLRPICGFVYSLW